MIVGNRCKDEKYPLVSVVVLSYRNIEGLKPTLKSIAAQDYPEVEIVISDDATPSFEDAIPMIKEVLLNGGFDLDNLIINSMVENVGTVKNANAALAMARGRYIKTISPDDCFATSTSISQYVEFMQNDGCLVAFAKLCGVNDADERFYNLASCEYDYEMLRTLSPKETFEKLCARNFLPGAAEFFDRRVFDEYGLFDESVRLIEDYTYWLHLSKNDVRFGYLDEYLIDYKLSGVSSSGHYSEVFMRDMIAIYDKYIFPNDRRYGFLQPVYNALKQAGLNYYVGEARYEGKKARLALHRLEYLPFYAYGSIANRNKKN